jgi:hypothetical protein
MPIRANWLTERSSHHAPDLLALLRSHEDGVRALRYDHCVGERIN